MPTAWLPWPGKVNARLVKLVASAWCSCLLRTSLCRARTGVQLAAAFAGGVRQSRQVVERHRRRIGAAEQDADLFARRRHVPARKQRGHRRGAAGFHRHPQHVPYRLLRRDDGVVGDQHRAVDVVRRRQSTARRCGGRRDCPRRCRSPGRRQGGRRRAHRGASGQFSGSTPIDTDVARPTPQRCRRSVRRRRPRPAPCRVPAPGSSHSSADGALPAQRLGHGRRRALRARRYRDPVVARLVGLHIAIAADDDLGTVWPDALDLGRRRDRRHIDACRDTELLRRIGDRRAMVAAGRRHHAVARHPSRISRLAKAPRALNVPECCRNSSLKVSGSPDSPKSAARPCDAPAFRGRAGGSRRSAASMSARLGGYDSWPRGYARPRRRVKAQTPLAFRRRFPLCDARIRSAGG